MAEEQGKPEPAEQQGAQPPAEAPVAAASAMDLKEVEEGKAFAVLSYVLSFLGLPFFLVPLIMRNNAFSLYHAKQCLMLWLVAIVGSAISVPLSVVCIGVVVALVVGIFCLVVNIIGLIGAAKGEAKPLPLVGKYAEEWFKGLTRA